MSYEQLLSEVCNLTNVNRDRVLNLISKIDGSDPSSAQVIYFTVESLIDLSQKDDSFPVTTQEIVETIVKTNPSLLPIVSTAEMKKYWPELLKDSLEQFRNIETEEVKNE